MHIQNIFKTGELEENRTTQKIRVVQNQKNKKARLEHCFVFGEPEKRQYHQLSFKRNFKSKELDEESVIQKIRITANNGKIIK